MIVCQLSVEKAMAKSAADTKEKMDAKHRVTALQKAILETLLFWAFCFNEPWTKFLNSEDWIYDYLWKSFSYAEPLLLDRAVLAGTTSGSGGVWG